ncbi:pseudouridine synthase [Alginatibacterium sediminis]|uniref:pseudouridine synthase n=1 Tax=Alginatibacterium sediminis TaxID=2164068 RepID=UPI001314E721|nr:pseudouridine synthase [Alginatibacterium sediminis]
MFSLPCRLDKYLCHNLVLTRSQVKTLLKSSEILLDGDVCKFGKQIITQEQVVTYQGKHITHRGHRYYQLNKPKGWVCDRDNPHYPCAIDLISDPVADELQVVGRLDADTTGLLLISSDGKWSQLVRSPNQNKFKTYQVELSQSISDAQIAQLEQGVELNAEPKPTLPAHCKRLNDNQIEISIQEGRYHQVKRMFAAVGNKVISLHRCQIAHIPLDPNLKPSESRLLNEAEIQGIPTSK